GRAGSAGRFALLGKTPPQGCLYGSSTKKHAPFCRQKNAYSSAGLGYAPPAAVMEESLTETIDAEMVGLAPGTALPFRFVPAAHMSPIVMSFPHVGLAWPSQLGHQPAVDFPRNADFEVHTLFRGIEAWGVATVRATVSRLVVDLNRAEDDVSDILVPDHPAPRPRRRPGSPSSSDPRDHADHADHANQANQADQADHGHRWDRPGRGVVWASAIGSYGRTTPML